MGRTFIYHCTDFSPWHDWTLVVAKLSAKTTKKRDDLVQSYVASTENNQPDTALVTTEESNKTAPETTAAVSQPVEITNNVLTRK